MCYDNTGAKLDYWDLYMSSDEMMSRYGSIHIYIYMHPGKTNMIIQRLISIYVNQYHGPKVGYWDSYLSP